MDYNYFIAGFVGGLVGRVIYKVDKYFCEEKWRNEVKSRENAITFIESYDTNYSKNKKDGWHYGLIELRELLDFLYNSEPKTDKEKLTRLGAK